MKHSLVLAPGPTRRQLIAASAVLALPWLARAQTPATQRDELWTDDARARALPVRLRLPAGDAPFALVVYSHGLGGNREGGDVWGRAWVDAGLAVVHVQHPGSDSPALRSGLGAVRRATSADNLPLRAADARFVLNEVARRAASGDRLWRRVRVDALGMAGHSFGARTTQALAGERFAKGDDLSEPRFKAFIALSPNLRQGRASASERFGAITRPFLCATGTLDEDPFIGGGAQQRTQVYAGLPSGAKAQLLLANADHYSFGGNSEPIRSGLIVRRAPQAQEREAVHHALIARMSAHWWRAQLLGDPQAQQALRAPAGLGADDVWSMG